MLVTDDEQAWEKAWAYKDHGKSFDAVYNRPQTPSYNFRWLHESFGTNFRMTELQAVLGRIQLRKLPEWTKSRRQNAAVLSAGFAEVSGIRVTPPPEHIGHAYYKYYAYSVPERLRDDGDRARVLKSINEAGVPCFSGSCSEIYLEKAFEGTVSRPVGRLPVARELGETSMMFLVHPTLDEANMRKTVEVVSAVMKLAVR